jgi:hypothetical protein
MKKAIPKEWVDIIKTENSKKSVLIKGNPYRFSILKNTFFYELLLNDQFVSPYNLFSDVCKID